MFEPITNDTAPPPKSSVGAVPVRRPKAHMMTAGTLQPIGEGFWEKTLHDPVATFTALLFLATTGLWIFTGFLWRATLRVASDAKASGTEQAEKMERSISQATRAAEAMEALARSNAASGAQLADSVNLNRRAMRATISVVIAKAVYQDAHLRFEAGPALLNKGPTEARNVQWKIAAAILPVPIPNDFKFPLPKEYIGGSVIGPQGDGTISAVVQNRFPDSEVADIMTGATRALFCWGCIKYKDIFGRIHRTTFAHQLRWVQTGRKPLFRRAPLVVNGYYLHKHNMSN